jgi:hypothetical protein
MTSSVQTGSNVRFAFPWMFGRGFDILFFFLPVFFGIALFGLTQTNLVSTSAILLALVVNAFGAGPFHWGPTWFAYFDKKNRTQWASQRSKQVIFFLAPPLIMLFSVVGAVYCIGIMFGITLLWAIQHLVQQNVGILLLYHNQGRGEAIVNRTLEVRTQHAAAFLFSTLFVYRTILHNPPGIVWPFLIAILSVWTLLVVLLYVLDLSKQMRVGAYLNVPATLFWAVSVFSLLPFAFLGNSFDQAFLIPVTVHWFQYIGLNYVLVKYKYSPDEQIQNLPTTPPLVLFFLTCVAFLALGVGLIVLKQSGLIVQGMTLSIVAGLLMGLANTHYFLDAFLWRFREKYQRETILPYLLLPRRERRS